MGIESQRKNWFYSHLNRIPVMFVRDPYTVKSYQADTKLIILIILSGCLIQGVNYSEKIPYTFQVKNLKKSQIPYILRRSNLPLGIENARLTFWESDYTPHF